MRVSKPLHHGGIRTGYEDKRQCASAVSLSHQMTKQTKHDRIFLHLSELRHGVLFCRLHQIDVDDVEYVRADLVEQQLAAKDALLRQAREAFEQVTDCVSMETLRLIISAVVAIDKEIRK
jgi:hypothetical protein